MTDPATRDQHVPGWRHQLALFANAATRQQHRDVAATIDRYFGLWSSPTRPRAAATSLR
jgi:hypothetical protein